MSLMQKWHLSAACLLLLACAGPPDLVGLDNPEFPVQSVADAKLQKIFIATTRQASESVGVLYSGKRALELGFASVQVSIPPTHKLGELERPKRLPPDPRREFAIVEPTVYQTEAAFITSINASLVERPASEQTILFFVHGYNNSTSDSLLRLAQFVEDSNYSGVAVLFDWASAAQVSRYAYDLNSTLIARPLLLTATEIMNRTSARGFDVFAHSMGSFLVMETLLSKAQRGQKLSDTGKLENIVLASPDIDMDLFRSQLSEMDTDFEGIFVLLSKDDSALKLSTRIAGGIPRVGAADAAALAELGVVAIDLSEVENSASGSHAKFAGSPEVVQVLGNGLNRSGTFSRTERSPLLGSMVRDSPITAVFK